MKIPGHLFLLRCDNVLKGGHGLNFIGRKECLGAVSIHMMHTDHRASIGQRLESGWDIMYSISLHRGHYDN